MRDGARRCTQAVRKARTDLASRKANVQETLSEAGPGKPLGGALESAEIPVGARGDSRWSPAAQSFLRAHQAIANHKRLPFMTISGFTAMQCVCFPVVLVCVIIFDWIGVLPSDQPPIGMAGPGRCMKKPP